MSHENNLKARITHKMLKAVDKLDEDGKVTPHKYWIDILNDENPELFELAPKDRAAVRLKAAEALAKYVYDQTLETSEVESLIKSKEDLDSIKSSLMEWATSH